MDISNLSAIPRCCDMLGTVHQPHAIIENRYKSTHSPRVPARTSRTEIRPIGIGQL